MSSRVDALRQQREQLNARIARAESRDREKARQQATRRKILVGAMILHRCNDRPSGELLEALSAYLTRDDDRELFGLAPR